MDIEQARFNMIEQQIRPWEVSDQQILSLIAEIPRERFVPDAFKHLAFADINIPLGHDQCMMSPPQEAKMLQALTIKKQDRVLEIGTGSGYVTALLANLAAHVRSEEIYADLSQQADKQLQASGIKNIDLVVTDSLKNRQFSDRYDVIVITGSMPLCEPIFKQQLSIGGRLFVILGEAPVMEACLIIRRSEREWTEESLFETSLPALVGAPQPEKFSL